MTTKTPQLALIAILALVSCANPNNKPSSRPICFTEGDLQVSYFYKCLNTVPEERRTANDLKECDNVSIIQASNQCASMGLQP